jgi:hypothetical protein
MKRDDLSRPILIDVSANGAVSIRDKGRPARGMLPFFSVDTREDARSLISLHCKLARDGSGTYWLSDFEPDSLDSLDAASDLFRASYARLLQRLEREANAEIERIAAKGMRS